MTRRRQLRLKKCVRVLPPRQGFTPASRRSSAQLSIRIGIHRVCSLTRAAVVVSIALCPPTDDDEAAPPAVRPLARSSSLSYTFLVVDAFARQQAAKGGRSKFVWAHTPTRVHPPACWSHQPLDRPQAILERAACVARVLRPRGLGFPNRSGSFRLPPRMPLQCAERGTCLVTGFRGAGGPCNPPSRSVPPRPRATLLV